MRKICVLGLLLLGAAIARPPALPPLNNNGYPERIQYVVKDYINKEVGFVTANISVETVTAQGRKYLHLESLEGRYFRNSVTLDYMSFQTVAEERHDIWGRSAKLLESYQQLPDGKVRFFHEAKNINLTADNPGNVYSRYAFLVSLSGFPFEQKDKIVMNVYMFEYGNVLPLRAVYQGKEKVQAPAGEFECYKLELAVDGVLGLFAPDKYYLYYTVAAPHHFVRFYQKVDDGSWLANELIKVSF
ncbi:MAG: DUF3108 domain-containing protein [Candidatus Margulisbacteria bacterium]|jgi:hypothetical protein|nr:DUF3108 domain-containing protein [Candidatus Margulisiibacteriota bacterium]